MKKKLWIIDTQITSYGIELIINVYDDEEAKNCIMRKKCEGFIKKSLINIEVHLDYTDDL